ncbi:MAG: branched-chain amino acid aminotransferase [Granulosicoccus sp.]
MSPNTSSSTTSPSILTFHDDRWQQGSVPVLRSADHGTWLGTLVFDGARRFDGVSPDLEAHCARVNRSAVSLGMNPSLSTGAIVERVNEGLAQFDDAAAVYIRPMYWSTGYGEGFISADPESTDFCLCLQEIPMPPADATATLATTRFTRPTLDVATVDAKAACLYPNNARMIREAIAKGFSNALVCDPLGNVAESATSNVFMARDGEVFTPIPNGTFLNGITRQRIMTLLRESGITVHESSLRYEDFHQADEVFLTGNISKVTPIVAFEETKYEIGPIAKLARAAYLDWARS